MSFRFACRGDGSIDRCPRRHESQTACFATSPNFITIQALEATITSVEELLPPLLLPKRPGPTASFPRDLSQNTCNDSPPIARPYPAVVAHGTLGSVSLSPKVLLRAIRAVLLAALYTTQLLTLATVNPRRGTATCIPKATDPQRKARHILRR